jgi:hypothetical protein
VALPVSGRAGGEKRSEMARDTGLTARPNVPRWRKVAGRAIQWIGFLLGAAFVLIYCALLWTDPASDLSHMRFRSIIGVYVVIPIILFGGPIWLFSWIAGRLDPDIARDL